MRRLVAQPSWLWAGRASCLAPYSLQSTPKAFGVGPTGSPPRVRPAADKMPVLRLICDRDWRADADRLEEILRHELRHPDATVGGGIAREIASMHSNSSMNAHKIRHGCAFEMSPGRLRIDPQLYIWLYHVISGIYVITIFGRNMVHILLLNREMPDWSV